MVEEIVDCLPLGGAEHAAASRSGSAWGRAREQPWPEQDARL